MDPRSFEPIQEILFRMNVRYLTVRPLGLVLEPGISPRRAVNARILNHGGARTLYRNRRPTCRSLDGIKALSLPDKRCQTCPERNRCTPQVRVDLLIEAQPYRLILAFTSARNFLFYAAQLAFRKHELRDTSTHIKVVNRGSWGELRFAESQQMSQSR